VTDPPASGRHHPPEPHVTGRPETGRHQAGSPGAGPQSAGSPGAGPRQAGSPGVRPPRTTVVLGLGSNLGDRLANLQGGVDALCAEPGLDGVAVSPVYETDPVGGPDQPDYLNAVLVAQTSLPARAVLDRGLAAEQAMGRVRGQRWGPRTLDVDVIIYGDLVSEDPELTLPHPRAHQRAFVLAPWLDVDPEAVIPGRGRVADLLAAAGSDGIRLRPDAHIWAPVKASQRGTRTSAHPGARR
jgi:2-amino-4-hydroxy-6-hydroxymethyldihydropteridine diphosphokinase